MHKIHFKNKKYDLKNRHALANVVTSAIILSAVSIMGVMMLQWSNTSLTTQKQQIEETFSTQTNKVNEDLIFDNVWFSSTCPGKCVNMTMSNVGTLGLNVTMIKLINGTTLSELKILNYRNGGIKPSSSFSTNATYSWKSSGNYAITVFTNRGNQFTTSVIAP